MARLLWAAPTSALGAMLILAGAYRVQLRVVGGALEAHGPALAWMLTHLVPLSGGATAMTFGHIVLARDARSLEDTRAHERVHVRQCERWGPLFVPAYLIASLFAALRGRHHYFDNPFERDAYVASRPSFTAARQPHSSYRRH
jgi:hypothetical protein